MTFIMQFCEYFTGCQDVDSLYFLISQHGEGFSTSSAAISKTSSLTPEIRYLKSIGYGTKNTCTQVVTKDVFRRERKSKT